MVKYSIVPTVSFEDENDIASEYSSSGIIVSSSHIPDENHEKSEFHHCSSSAPVPLREMRQNEYYDLDERNDRMFAAVDNKQAYSRKSSMARLLLRYSVIGALLSFLLHYSLPPAPPPSRSSDDPSLLSWTQYIREHTEDLLRSSRALFWETPMHIVYWGVQNCISEGERFFSDLPAISYFTCNPKLPDTIKNGVIPHLQTTVFGQDEAIRQIAMQLGDETEPYRTKIWAFVGSPSTGKQHMVKKLATYFTGHCRQYYDRVPIILDGRDYSLPSEALASSFRYMTVEEQQAELKNRLVYKVSQESKKYPPNVHQFYVIREAERMDPSVLVSFLRDISSNQQGEHSKNEIRFLTYRSNIVFVLLLEDGQLTRVIGQALSAYDDPNLSTLESELVYQLDQLYQPKSISKFLNTVVPFEPLTQDSLHQILKSKVSSLSHEQKEKLWSSLSVNDDVLRLLVSENHVEYLTVHKRGEDTRRPRYTFANGGASVIQKHFSWLKAEILHCIAKYEHRPIQLLSVGLEQDSRGHTLALRWCNGDALLNCDEESFCRFFVR